MYQKFLAHRKLVVTALVFVFALVVGVVPTFAQSTPVALNIPIDSILSSTNTWMAALAPVVTPGIAIAIAIVVLSFLGNALIKAFRGKGMSN
jgi:hypothetical protein